jgi:hypothetical protein
MFWNFWSAESGFTAPAMSALLELGQQLDSEAARERAGLP